MGRAVLADAHRIVGEDIGHRQAGEGGEPDRRPQVIGEHQERGRRGAEQAVVGDAVADCAHRVLADAEPDVAAERVGAGKLAAVGEVVLGRPEQVGRPGEQLRHGRGDRVDDHAAVAAGGVGRAGRELGNPCQQVRGGRLGEAGGEFAGELGVGRRPRVAGRLPVVELAGVPGLAGGEERAHLVGDEERVRGQAERLAGGGGELGAALAVRLGGAGDLRDPLADQRAGDDRLRPAVVGRLRVRDRRGDRREVVAVDRHRVPPLRAEVALAVLALGDLRGCVEGDVVGVVDQDQVVEAVVAGERDRLAGHAFLEAAVAGQRDHVVVEDRVPGGVEAGRGAAAGEGVADRVAQPLAERAGGRLHPRRLAELRVPRRGRVQLAEVPQGVERHLVAGEVQPAVEEHRPVAGRQHEAVAVRPLRGRRVEPQRLAEQHRPDLRAAERQPEVPGRTGVHGINGKSPGLRRGGG